jgi:uncharacterized RDD family membrane protein YckC
LIECLDAYRAKHREGTPSVPPPSTVSSDSKASHIARRVAQRYASAPAYREVLEAQAKREAEERILAAQARLDFEPNIESPAEAEIAASALAPQDSPVAEPMDAKAECASEPSVTVSGEKEVAAPLHGTAVLPQFAARTQEMHLHQSTPEPEPTLEDLWASALIEPRSLLPSKLIEFPRELVSTQRLRGRAIQEPAPESPQLRIFEVQPETGAQPVEPNAAVVENQPAESRISAEASGVVLESGPAQTAPAAETTTSASVPSSSGHGHFTPATSGTSARAYKSLEWAAISLDREPVVSRPKTQSSISEFVPFLVDPASIDRRLMAFAVDFSAVTAGFLAFLLVFAAATPHLPTGLTAIALGGAVYVALWVLYQMLFFSLNGSTAGMMYARIALCTFDDQNPTRLALRRRLAAWWLSCLPLGMGFLWCFVDEDNLSWHDRMTHMYQREY